MSPLLLPSVSSYKIPGSHFSSGSGTEYELYINAINGLHPGDDDAFDEIPEVGFEIDGPKGYFIGLNQSDGIKIYVND